MKQKLTVTVEKEVIEWIKLEVKTGRFRNISHGLERCARLEKNRKSNE